MEGLPSIAAEKLKVQLHDMVDAFAEEIVAIVNQAREGHLIDDSEEPVRIAGKELLRRAYEVALQRKIDASEASFPPPETVTVDPVTRQPVTKRLRNKGKQSRTVLTVNGRVKLVRRWWHAPDVGSLVPVDDLVDAQAKAEAEGHPSTTPTSGEPFRRARL